MRHGFCINFNMLLEWETRRDSSVRNEIAVQYESKKSQCNFELHTQRLCNTEQEDNSSSLLGSGEKAPRILHAVVGPKMLEIYKLAVIQRTATKVIKGAKGVIC